MCNRNEFIPSLNANQIAALCQIYVVGGKDYRKAVTLYDLQNNAIDFDLEKILKQLTNITLNIEETRWIKDDDTLSEAQSFSLIMYEVSNNTYKILKEGESLLEMYSSQHIISD